MKKLTQNDQENIPIYIEGQIQKVLSNPNRNRFYLLADDEIGQIVALAILEGKRVESALIKAQIREEKQRDRFKTNHLNE